MIISWLEAQKVDFLSTNVDKLGSQQGNVFANIMWYISGKIWNAVTQWNLHIIPVALKVSVSIEELKTAMKQKVFTTCVLTVKLKANSIFQGENVFRPSKSDQ